SHRPGGRCPRAERVRRRHQGTQRPACRNRQGARHESSAVRRARLCRAVTRCHALQCRSPKAFREEALRHVIAVVAAFLTILTLLQGPAAAAWPDKPVRVIVPYAAGGANDLLGRVFAEQLSKRFGQQFFVENRTGGGGLIGTEAVARSAPDGSTLIISGMPSHVLAPAMNKNASFDPIKDFTHIAYLGGPPNVFVVHPSAGVNSFKE